jgi:phosphocarrier protein
MVNFKYTIKNPVGIHARPAGKLVKLVNTFESIIIVEKDGKRVEAKKLFSLITLGVKQGQEVIVSAEGFDEVKALDAVKTLFIENL